MGFYYNDEIESEMRDNMWKIAKLKLEEITTENVLKILGNNLAMKVTNLGENYLHVCQALLPDPKMVRLMHVLLELGVNPNQLGKNYDDPWDLYNSFLHKLVENKYSENFGMSLISDEDVADIIKLAVEKYGYNVNLLNSYGNNLLMDIANSRSLFDAWFLTDMEGFLTEHGTNLEQDNSDKKTYRRIKEDALTNEDIRGDGDDYWNYW